MPLQSNKRPETDTIALGALNTHKSSADHDGRYYTESETNSLLNAKALLAGSSTQDFSAKSLSTDQVNTTGLTITGSDTNKTTCTVTAPLSQSANIQEWKYNTTIRSVINATGYLGLATNNPQTPLHLVVGTLPSAMSSVSFLLQGNPNTAGYAETAMIAGTAGQCIMNFGDSDTKAAGRIIFDNSTDQMKFYAASLNLLKLDSPNRAVTIGHDYWCSVTALAASFNLTGYKAKLKIQGNAVSQENGLLIYEADNYGYDLLSDGANDKFIFKCNENTSYKTAYEIARSTGIMTVTKGIYNSSDGSAGLTTTVALAKITSGGTDGSLTFKDGLLTAKVDPT